MYDLGTLPSPVDPKMRNLEFCCCWSLGSKGLQGDDEKVLVDLLEEVIKKGFQTSRYRLFVDRDAMTEPYLFLYLTPLNLDLMLSTPRLLEQLSPELETLLRSLEETISAGVENAVRATREFWWRKIGLLFPDCLPGISRVDE